MPGFNWDETVREEVSGARLNDQNIRIASGNLTAGAINTKIFSWQNTVVSGVIIVHLILIDVTTVSTAAANINVGQAATEVASDNLIDGAALNTLGVRNSVANGGTNGKGAQRVADDQWITGFEDNSFASTGLVGKYYIFYTKI